MNKQQKKLAMKASALAIEARFPYGTNKGDPLARAINLGNTFRSVDRCDFKIERKKNV